MRDVRAVSIDVIQAVLDGAPLNDALDHHRDHPRLPEIQFITFGVFRFYDQLQALLALLLNKSLKAKDRDIEVVLLIALFQLQHSRVKPYAIVDESVKLCVSLKKVWAKGVVNASLRRFQREHEALLGELVQSEEAFYSHPQYLIDRIKSAYPSDWQAILDANNGQAPMSLRVNTQQASRDSYLASLKNAGIEADVCEHSTAGLRLRSAVNVSALPNFSEGAVSVQDEAAQLAVYILAPKSGEKILDACAAPGGKACHLWEYEPAVRLTALDVSESRLNKVRENCTRLKANMQTVCADLRQYSETGFDAVLLDAPCSALGVIRRHPDIKTLRSEEDIASAVALQAEVLDAAWRCLKSGGRLLYATCSILPEENSEQIAAFLARHADAREQPIDASWGHAMAHGRQILPGESAMDGFYYALLVMA
ncbi:MAG: 16S rRNA (cytosine(967)-C(5))-methyltransferase [Gammaproteobacteria bacterium CG11_big_fil_rev_8_21_14_0_20_46_22]|nr:MAG: 16S rRNA (cytosine(967)-C(5))-methyltransferase [Gammaproteobacteria bacterium CG12_big_fil_rev_8_21_14_0_65_46_12]PIR10656.1 MAG: 16S rRNA (cytosine(967)-C(5))-methyltransferase [Gammaproteobacteria bacterium CG11_big_fil_rev_8_21_14_0_20_46_22]